MQIEQGLSEMQIYPNSVWNGVHVCYRVVVVYLKRKFNECSIFHLATQTQGNPRVRLAENQRFPRTWIFSADMGEVSST